MRRQVQGQGIDVGAVSPLPSEIRAQVRLIADQPEDGLLWSDVASLARNAFVVARRRLGVRHAPAAH